MRELIVVGGGLAGSEAAWQAAERGIKVRLYEMRLNDKLTNAHKTDLLAELVCSNSFRNDSLDSAIGLLHKEMRLLNSLIMKVADETKIPAGGALAMDREEFSKKVQSSIENHPNITLIRDEITELPISDSAIIATGPLTSDSLSQDILKYTGTENLAFFDAIAPIVYKESINFDIAWFQSRYDKVGPANGNGKDYINCPLNEEEYRAFIKALLESETTNFKEWEMNTPYFNGCLPIEVMAARGENTLRFGPMKPVGLTDPRTGKKPYAVVQLRQDNKLGTLYNIVGFQTKLKYGFQTQVFKMIPGLENAEFARLGGLHRNSFINSPILLDKILRLKSYNNIRFAGQITGVEGYVESAACGLMAGIFAAQELNGETPSIPPQETALGALIAHITGNAEAETFQPMNVNFGLFPNLNIKCNKMDRKKAYSERALKFLAQWKTSLYSKQPANILLVE